MQVPLANQDLRSLCKKHGIRLWEIAERLNISDSKFTRALRHELTDDWKKQIVDAMNQIVAARRPGSEVRKDATAEPKEA